MAFVNVEELMRQVTVEQAVAYYGIALPEIRRVGNEVRTRCFLACGRSEETGDRALSIQPEHPARIWRCHQYGCGKGGNLISLCDLMKPGPHAEGKPRGERFKAIIADLLAMTQGETAKAVSTPQPQAQPEPAAPAEPEPRVNTPLARSDNERARGLMSLDAKFIVDVAQMARAGVTPATAQRLARHSDINLTLGTYTRLQVAELAGAVERLPDLRPSPASNEKAVDAQPQEETSTPTDPRLAGVVAAWPDLPEHIHQAILALVGIVSRDASTQPDG